MSKPVSNSDVEDVLSSVRRLVSDNKAKDGSDAVEKKTERLVLSPQLRVGDTGVLRLRPEDAVAAGKDVAKEPGTNIPSSDSAKTENDKPSAQQPDAEVISENDPPVSLNDGAFEAPEGGGAPNNAARAFGVNDLTAKIAALETAIAKTADQWEPDGTGRDAYAGTQPRAMSWQDSVELDATGAPLSPQADAADDTHAAKKSFSSSVEEQLLDEEALREIVAEIVRSELQGALGERITRNVRKLVRREIHRTLAAQNLQ